MTMERPSWGRASDILVAEGFPDAPVYLNAFGEGDEQALLTIPLRVQAAWANNSARDWADIFSENGGAMIDDQFLLGRETIYKYMIDGFSGDYRGASVTGSSLFTQFLSDDVALLVTEGGTLMAGEAELPPENLVRNIWVIVREAEGKLSLLSHQSSPVMGV